MLLLFQHTHCSDPLPWLLHCAVTFFSATGFRVCEGVYCTHRVNLFWAHHSRDLLWAVVLQMESPVARFTFGILCITSGLLIMGYYFGRNR